VAGIFLEQGVDALGFEVQLVMILGHAGAMLPEEIGAKIVLVFARQVKGGHDQFEQVGLIKRVVETQVAKGFEEVAALELFANELDNGFLACGLFGGWGDGVHDAGD
jgi:hypothetical protein